MMSPKKKLPAKSMECKFPGSIWPTTCFLSFDNSINIVITGKSFYFFDTDKILYCFFFLISWR
jgi:hypothetical protein